MSRVTRSTKKVPEGPAQGGNTAEPNEEQASPEDTLLPTRDMRGDVGDEHVPEWIMQLFPDPVAWKFPVCDEMNGHLSGQLDTILPLLEQQARSCDGELRAKYQAYAQVWPILRQSVLYGKLMATMLAKMADSCEQDDLQDDFQHMEMMFQGLLSDQLQCASVIMVAATHSEVGAQKVASALRAKATGFHPALLDKIMDLGPPPAKTSAYKKKVFNKAEAQSKGKANGHGFSKNLQQGKSANLSPSPIHQKQGAPSSAGSGEQGSN